MAFVNLPEFVARQILTAALLNQIVSALSGFSTQTGDISWPLLAGGNIDFVKLYGIDGLQTFWNIVNASEYASLDAALDAVEATTGGCLFIPPHTTVKGSTGVTVDASNVWVVGCGPTSIVELETGAGPLFNTAANLSNIGFMNLQLLESSSTSSADGIVFRRTTSPALINVLFTNFDGDSVYYTNDGTPGNPCADAYINGTTFSGGGANGNHLKADDLDGLFMTQTLSKSAGGTAFFMEPASASSIIRDIQMDSTVRVELPGSKGISILGEALASDDKYSRISLLGTKVISPASTAFEIGATSKIMREVQLLGCAAQGTMTGLTAFHVNADRGDIKDCRTRAAGTGIDLEDSVDLDVQSNSLRSCTTGIDASALTATSGTAAWNNNLTGCTTPISFPIVDAGFEAGNNIGVKGKLMGGTVFMVIDYTNSGTGAELAWTYVVPGGTLVKAGDGLTVRVTGFRASGAATTQLQIKVGGTAVAEAETTQQNTTSAAHAHVFLNGAPGATLNTNSWGEGLVGDTAESGLTGDLDLQDDANKTVDWTSDVSIEIIIQSSLASLFKVRYGYVQFFEGELGGS